MNVFICGVGGQGILVSSDILAEVALISGLDVKKSEVHGMAQRGGAVVSAVKYGKKVYSPLIGIGEADIILAFEKLEALRNINYLNPNGMCIINDYELPPLSVIRDETEYPKDIKFQIKKKVSKIMLVDAVQLAKQAGDVKTVNVVLLGALSKKIEFSNESWLAAIEKCIRPKFWEINRKAFLLGNQC